MKFSKHWFPDLILFTLSAPIIFSLSVEKTGRILHPPIEYYFLVALNISILFLFGAYSKPKIGLQKITIHSFILGQLFFLTFISTIAMITGIRYEGQFWGRTTFFGSQLLNFGCGLLFRFLFQIFNSKKNSFPSIKIIGSLDDKKFFVNLLNRSVKNFPARTQQKIFQSETVPTIKKSTQTNQEIWIITSQRTFSNNSFQMKKIIHARMAGIEVMRIEDFAEKYLSLIPIEKTRPLWLMLRSSYSLQSSKLQQRMKTLLDFFISATFLLLLSPLLALFIIIIKLTSHGPIFFTQERTGFKGKPFKIYKLRSMISDAEKSGPQWAQKDDPRVTSFGKFMRLFRFDEIPQLWNILKGDMSLIGPRPERPIFVESLRKEIAFYDLRHEVKPGLTGWAQIHYPYGASVEDAKRKLEYDLYYIRNYSFFIDLKITFNTILIVILGKGR